MKVCFGYEDPLFRRLHEVLPVVDRSAEAGIGN
jgi:hypothetical protein